MCLRVCIYVSVFVCKAESESWHKTKCCHVCVKNHCDKMEPLCVVLDNSAAMLPSNSANNGSPSVL